MDNNKPADHGQIIRALGIALKVVQSLDDKKARDVKVLGVNKQTVLADFLIIAGGTSSTHIRALSDEVEFKLKEDMGEDALHRDGVDSDDWRVLDYGSVIVHIFNAEAREYYKLEKLWSEGESLSPEEIIAKIKEG